MTNLKHMDKLFARQPGNSLLSLAFDASHVEGALVRRTNGTVEIRRSFTASLALDPLTAEIELVARELRNQLDAQQIRERWCVVSLPLSWVLTCSVKLPEIPEADVPDFLSLEAERGFPYAPDELMLATSRFTTADGARYATLVAVPRQQVTRLEAVLAAAQLRPVSFSLGLTALQPAADARAPGVLALWPGEAGVGIQITAGGGVVALRMIDGVYEPAGGHQELLADQLRREVRITLGQLPAEIRDEIQTVRVLGRSELAVEIAEGAEAGARNWGCSLEHIREHAAQEFGVKVPAGTAISPAVAVAVRRLAGEPGMEFLPPKISQWQQLTERYSSGRLFYAGAGAGAVAAVVMLAFLVQQILLWHWQSQWARMEPRVTELTQMRDEIRRYRPWFDESVRTLSILKCVTEAFPVDGAISAKTLELREPARVTCSGTARNREALITMLDNLRRQSNSVAEVHIETTRGNTPLEFTFNFQWRGPGAP
jgi:hypothetical protein